MEAENLNNLNEELDLESSDDDSEQGIKSSQPTKKKSEKAKWSQEEASQNLRIDFHAISPLLFFDPVHSLNPNRIGVENPLLFSFLSPFALDLYSISVRHCDGCWVGREL